MIATDRVVLIGEPDEPTNELYQRTLRTAFHVIAAPDAHALLAALHTHPVAVVVLEPTLFGAQSWARLPEISSACSERGIPLIICSTLDERRRGIELGATMYLIKPTLPATLLDAVRRVLGGVPS
jgi:DNA-binding response OmpR family regulator